jgi:hypothetical protein
VQIERRIKLAGVDSVRAAAVLPAAHTPVNRTYALRMRRFKVRGGHGSKIAARGTSGRAIIPLHA